MLLFGFAFGGRRGGSGSGGGFTGGIVKPPRAIASATAINPTVVIAPTGSGNILVSPDPAIAAAVAVDPTILSDILVSPAAAIAAASAVDPTSMEFDPADLANIALIIDPSDISTLFQNVAGTTPVAASGQTVGFASDLSGNSFNLTAAADDTTRPTYATTDAPHISFDGTNDQLRRAVSLGMYAAGTCSIFMGVRFLDATTNVTVIHEGSSAAVAAFYGVVNDTSPATVANEFFRNDTPTNLSVRQVAITGAFDGTDNIVALIDDGTDVTGYLDGTQIDTASYTRSGTVTVDRFSLGSFWGSTFVSGHSQFRLYALVIVNREVTVDEKADIEAWIADRMPSASPSIAPHALYYSMNKDSQMQYLRQATASQTVLIGPFVDAGDAVTPETGLTIANTDIRLSVNGGNMAAKNSGGGTHDELGMYAITLDATDTATVGKLKLNCAMSGALPVFETFHVVEEVVFDQMFAAAAPGAATPAALATVDTVVDGIKLVTDAQANIVGSGTCDTGGSTTAVIASSIAPSSVEDDQFNGRIIVFHNDTTTTALRGQATLITDYTHSTLTFTVDTLSEAPASGDTFSIL